MEPLQNSASVKIMPRHKSLIPSYLKHKQTGQARAVFGKEQILLGPYGSPESLAAYQKAISNFHAFGSLRGPTNDRYPIAKGVADFLAYLRSEYDGRSEVPRNIGIALRLLVSNFGEMSVSDFEAADFIRLRQMWVDSGIARSTVVKNHFATLRFFRHLTTLRLYPHDAIVRLASVSTVRKAQGKAREPRKIKPVSREHVMLTLPHLNRQFQGMVVIQWLTGMRPEEACNLTWSQIDTTGEIWWYSPDRHKKKEADIIRQVGIGPYAQQILNMFRDRDPDRAIFSAADAMIERGDYRAKNRKTPMTPSHRARVRAVPTRDFYMVNGYRQAIKHACENAGIPKWAPNQLRHATGTGVRKDFGLDHAQAVLGHQHANITEIYAEIDRQKIEKVMREIG